MHPRPGGQGRRRALLGINTERRTSWAGELATHVRKATRPEAKTGSAVHDWDPRGSIRAISDSPYAISTFLTPTKLGHGTDTTSSREVDAVLLPSAVVAVRNSASHFIAAWALIDTLCSGFGFVDSNGSPLCMLCSKLLLNSSMAPAKLRRHLETVHPESKDKNKEFFVRKKEQLLKTQKNMMHVTQTINEKTTEASYLVSYRIAQAGEAHTIAENLIKPCVLDITKCMLDEKSAKHLSTVPLSNDTVSRRIHDLASYAKQELVTRLQKTRFALQMDESTDVAGLAILVIVRYLYESSFEEDMVMCSPLRRCPQTLPGKKFLIK
ncbi:Zinc finger BED domain-containing protein 5 [Eumeta japonica]|uniref:Zinc finger BED domain-containing protein 5 n=1 Tax=Eumeta variegata TaxID=151549 RepID=A0A4C1WU35_EUMVA|nr:Zinc finger BED domain-containing protein 5 [Eumeta japonica]